MSTTALCHHYPRITECIIYRPPETPQPETPQDDLLEAQGKFIDAIEKNDVAEMEKIALEIINNDYIIEGMSIGVLYDKCKSIEALRYITTVLKHKKFILSKWDDLAILEKIKTAYFVASNGGTVNVLKYALKQKASVISALALPCLALIFCYYTCNQ